METAECLQNPAFRNHKWLGFSFCLKSCKSSEQITRPTSSIFQRDDLPVDQNTAKLGHVGDILDPLPEAGQQVLVVHPLWGNKAALTHTLVVTVPSVKRKIFFKAPNHGSSSF